MKSLLILAAMAALAGCAVAPAPMYYTPVAQQNYDPHQWHTVPADQPVAAAPQQYVAQQYVAQPGAAYTTEPVYAPVYAAPVYVTGPAYQPYYYPPVAIGLDFGFGFGCCRGGWGRGGWGRGGYHHR